ncbi:helix-turn-helix domain-containing protein [Natronobacterium texcoconense]|uniref:HTH DNA binding domain-containing protein n=1 Tax=Natronobacterium texcoconense TaxID=1095778 RepID=A0A1H1C3A0_NATTX|nr:helix-turn-helix domain-containing protein [Natronobacterium texcoconense]SDQ58564.1 hypothetical protein SAMN04489842_1249 [Natronobacterium texcoconense]
MALIVEYELRTPVLRPAEATDNRIHLEEGYSTESGALKLLFWAIGEESESFQATVRDDQNVIELSLLEETVDRRLYSVTLTDRAANKLTYPLAAEHDIVILEGVVTDSTLVRARAPSREALYAYRDSCLERNVGFRVKRIYQEKERATDRYGITESQREALLAAFEAGYFAVPRDTSLSDISAELGISDQALSARLRRGQANLLAQTLGKDLPRFE